MVLLLVARTHTPHLAVLVRLSALRLAGGRLGVPEPANEDQSTRKCRVQVVFLIEGEEAEEDHGCLADAAENVERSGADHPLTLE
eukprot:CAMPEP_0167788828 /NCGR_PEP_ID=MMETSP0111_2-20121227/10284_1 /TAXON_ID=91324 /ORGANISM="Lotharella globosa, Strain CCCM811" /LENGTH=84 /DNA_ID=CAMNT_0007680803 /DNA_START=249 /DNA_END=503 /DNA_ORIENTATION=+